MNRRRLLCLAALLHVLAVLPMAAETFVYAKKSTRMTGTYTVRIEKNGAGCILSTQTAENGELVTKVTERLDERLATQEWSCWNKPAEVDVKAVRRNNKIFVTGTKKGKPVNVTLAIDDRPWIQQFPFGFEKFITSDEKQLEYWAISPSDFRSGTFVVVKTARETVTALGREEKTWKVRVSLAGFLSGFWGINYWLCSANGRWVRFRGDDGPGTPALAIDLVEHSD
jgi:hypothetical protein